MAALTKVAKLGASAREAARVCARGARVHHAPFHVVARRLLTLRRRGFGLEEAYGLGLLDPRESLAGAERYVPKRAMLARQRVLNPVALEALTEDKALFHVHAAALGLPVPELLGILTPGTPGWSPGGTLAGPEDLARVLASGPAELVVKPARGYHGLGVRALTRRPDGALRDADEAPVDPRDLHAELRGDRRFASWVIEQRVRNRGEIDALVGSPALATLRVNTYVAPDGDVRLVHASMRLPAGSATVDNFRGGALGNLSVGVDPVRGTLRTAIAGGPDGVGETLVERHPRTGVRIEGYPVPDWERSLDLLHRASRAFLPMRSLGWDLGLTEAGPVIVEANMWWDPPNFRGGDAREALRILDAPPGAAPGALSARRAADPVAR
jgi:putative polysaccharide biosynthesis protein